MGTLIGLLIRKVILGLWIFTLPWGALSALIHLRPYMMTLLKVNPFLFIRGLSCPRRVKTSLTHHCLELTMSGYPYNLLPVSCGDTSFKKSLGQVLAWKSGLKVPLLPIGPSCPLQTILLYDLVRCECVTARCRE
jgi:hypothetical protein